MRRRLRAWTSSLLIVLSMSPWMASAATTGAAPAGGRIILGAGQIQHAGDVTTIRQDSGTLLLNWQSFDVGARQTVNFLQPGVSAVAVNRILGNSASEIYGHLNANGQVWLINPNGVLFGRGAQVHVGGIVASSLDLDAQTLGTGSVRFAGDGRGKVINQGSLIAAAGGYVALLGNTVSNQGTIRARLGTVALGGGSAMTLTFADNHLMHLMVDASSIRSLVGNHQLIVADGGNVLMTAGARNSLIASVVNNSGTVQARTVAEHDGTITLLGGMQAGTVDVGGTLDASAPDGGNGGFIETSGARVHVAAGAAITTQAGIGKTGTWLLDPTDFTIAASGGDITGSALSSQLAGTSVTFASSDGTGGTAGDVNIEDAVAWNANTTLTLAASHNVVVNSGGSITNTGAGGKTLLEAGNAFVNHAGPAALGGNWVVYSTAPANDTPDGLTPAFIQYNATPGSTLAGGGNAFVYSTAPTLTITGLAGTVSKTYDATTAADTFTGANFNSSGLLGGDTIGTATGGSYAQASVGSSIKVTTPGLIGDFTITRGGIPVHGYALAGAPVTAAVGTINPAPLTVSIIGDPTKVYDGTTTATLGPSNYAIGGWMGSDADAGNGASVEQPSSVAYAGAAAGAEQVNATFTITNFKAQGSTQLSNYILPGAGTGAGTIKQAPLLISGLLANNKVYDGTPTATLVTGGAALYGVIQPDSGDVSLVAAAMAGAFAQADVGNGISVTVSGYALSGSKAGNYALVAPTDLTANITPRSLTISQVVAPDKTYDGTTTATLDTSRAALDGVIGGDAVTLDASAASGQFSQADVGNNLGVTDSGFALAGSGKDNYALVQPTQVASITPALLSIALTGTPEKAYDGTNAVMLGAGNFGITGFIGAQDATIFQSSATYASAHAGTGIDVTATLQPSDFTPAAGTSMSNYTFATTVVGVGIGTIDPLPLTGAIVGNPTKVYDGNSSATLAAANLVLNGALPGQTVTPVFAGGKTIVGTGGNGYSSANAGAWSITADGSAFGAGDFAAGGGALISDYLLPTVWTGSGTIKPAPLSGQVITAGIGRLDGGVTATKVYDGTTAITLDGDNFVLHGFVNTDAATVNNGVAGTFGQADVGTDLPLSATLTLGDLTPVGTTNLNNYAIQNPALGVGDITPAPLAVTIVGTPTKVYNGSNLAALSRSNFQVSGWAIATHEGGFINPTATATYDTASINASTVTAVLTPGNYVPDAGTKLSNYTLVYTATGGGAITRAPLYITGVYATGKTYDTTAGDTLNLAAAGLAGLVRGDAGQVSLDAGSTAAHFVASDGTTPEANAGTWSVAASGFTLAGAHAFNYDLQPLTGLVASIDKAPLSITGVVAQSKDYDGTKVATLNVGGAGLAGVLGSDSVGLDASGYSASFANANAGTWSVSAEGFALNGAADGNYTLQQPTGLSATIQRKPLIAEIVGTVSKMYDGTDSATLTADNYTLGGFVAGQGASVPQSATANYATTNAGTGLTVNSTLVVSDFEANAGTNLANYILPTAGTGTIGTITPFVLNLAGTRVYDQTTNASANAFGANGTLAGIKGQTVALTGAGQTSSKNVGTYAGFDISGLALNDSGNGGLAQNYTLAGGVDTFTITPRPLSATFDASGKTYDGNRSDTLSDAALVASAGGNSGLIAGDAVTLTNPTAGTFDTKNVGIGKTVTGAMGTAGADAGNYAFTNGTATAAITALGIAVTATGKDKVYDGTTADPGLVIASTGVLAGDTITFTGDVAFVNPNVANGIAINVNNIVAGGADAGNYTFNTSATTSADITPYQINLTGTRVYDGTTNAGYALFAAGGVLATGVDGESLALAGAGSTADKNVANKKVVALGTLALSNGAGGDLASNYQLAGAKLSITKRALTNTITAGNKVYDGDTAATLTGDTLVDAAGGGDGLLAGDAVTLTNAAVGTFASKDVGSGIKVTGAAGITGADAGNYAFTNATTTADITQRNLTVTATGSDKPYDGNDGASVTLGSDAVAGDSLIFTRTSATYGGVDVGAYTISVAGIGVGGAAAGNYHLLDTSTTTVGSITPRLLNLDGARTYDGSDSAATGTFNGFAGIGAVNGDGTFATGVGSESLTLTGPLTLASRNAGTYAGIVNDGLSLGDGDDGGKAGNYAIGTIGYTINKVRLDLAGTRVYDGTVGAAASLFGSNGVLTGINGETVSVAGTGRVGTKDVGSNQAFADLGSLTLADGSHGGLAGNYTLVGGTDALTITAKGIDVTATAANKVYDTTNGATVSALASGGVIPGDSVSFGSSSAIFADANVGIGRTVTVTGISAGGADAGNYTLDSTTATTTANITPYVLNLAGTRVYDGSVDAGASLFGGSGVLNGLNGQTLNLAGTGHVANKDVGNNKPFADLGSLMLSDGSNGGVATNYTLAGGTDTLTITVKGIDVTATAANKIYDTTRDAALTALTGTGVLAGDAVTFGDGSATFADANVGTGKTVTVTGLTLGGTDAGNYTLASTMATTTATIMPYVLDLAGTRIYDGDVDAAANLFGTAGVLSGLNGQTLNLAGSGQAGDKNVGNNKPLTSLGSLLLSDGSNGGVATNYTLAGGTDTLTITPKPISVSVTAANKVYDATAAATLTLVAGAIAGDVLTPGDGSATFANANVGAGKAVTVTGLTLGGTDAGNYALTSTTANTTANITPYVLNLAGTRVYDGTVDAAADLFGSHGVLTGIDGQTLSLAGTGHVGDKNVGTNKSLADLGSLSLGDGTGAAGNYTLAGGTDTLTITPRALGMTGTAVDRVYNGTDVIAIQGAALVGLVPGDQVTLGGDTQGTVADKNVGNHKAVTANTTIAGSDAGNYILTPPVGLFASITPKPISVSVTAANKVYDGNTVAMLTSLTGSGLIAGDTLGLGYAAANFSDPNVGNGKMVVATGITETGPDAGNYALTSATAITTADITGAQSSTFGVNAGLLAQLSGALNPVRIATPYGLAGPVTVGVYTGNKKRLHRPVERNVSRSDFTSGLALRVIDGGVRIPQPRVAPPPVTPGSMP